MKKGQITIEFLIILVIMVLLFTGISLDLIGSTIDDSIYIQTSQLVNTADFMITSTQKNLLLQGKGARKMLIIHAPKLCSFEFVGKIIRLECDDAAAQFHGMELGIANENVLHSALKIEGGERAEVEFLRV